MSDNQIDASGWHIDRGQSAADGSQTRAQTEQQLTSGVNKQTQHMSQEDRDDAKKGALTDVNKAEAYQQALRDQGKQLASGVNKRADVSMPGTAYDGVDHQTLYDHVHNNVNTPAIGAMGEDFATASRELAATQDGAASNITKSMSWSGPAGDGGRSFVAQLASYAGQVSTGIGLLGNNMQQQSEQLNYAKYTMPEVPANQVNSNTLVTSTQGITDPVKLQQARTQFNQQYAQQQELQQQAAHIVTTLDTNYGATGIAPTFGKITEPGNSKGPGGTTGGYGGTVGKTSHVVYKGGSGGTTGKTGGAGGTTGGGGSGSGSGGSGGGGTTGGGGSGNGGGTGGGDGSGDGSGNTGTTGVSNVGTADSGLATGFGGVGAGSSGSGSDQVRSGSGFGSGSAAEGYGSSSPYGFDGAKAGAANRALGAGGQLGTMKLPTNPTTQGSLSRAAATGQSGQNGMPGGGGGKKPGNSDKEHTNKYKTENDVMKGPKRPWWMDAEEEEVDPIDVMINRCGIRDFGRAGLTLDDQRRMRKERNWSNWDAPLKSFLVKRPLTGTSIDYIDTGY